MIGPEDSVIVLIDVQGKLAEIMHESTHLHQQIATMLQAAPLFNIPVLQVEQLPEKLGQTSATLLPYLQPLSAIAKNTFSACDNPEFLRQLQECGRKHVILMGIETHICVYQTCRGLLSNHYRVTVLQDAVSSRSLDNKQLGLSMMQSQGAALSGVEALLFEWQGIAEGDRFKQLLKLIK